MIGEKINQYEITAHLGTGGMGEVYLAVDSKLDREVALKFLPKELAAESDVKARFLQEARAASALNHPNICTIHDIQDHDGQMFIVMEHIDGETLRDKKDKLSTNQILEIGAQIADGLGAAHAKGIIHRDIKTENIMVRKDGIVQIMDFGLAKLRGVSRLTKEGSTLGTVGYMSPEQALGQDVDHRSDIFSLGVVLYELLTGQLPFQGAHEAAIMYEIVNVDSAPPSTLNPDIDPELDRIVLECLQKDPDERHQSAKEVAKDLRRFKRDSGRKRVSRISQVRPSRAVTTFRQQTAPHETVTTRAVSSGKGSLTLWIVAAVALVVAVASVVWKLATPGPDRQVVRANINPPPATSYYNLSGGHIALSPDGRYLAFVGVDSASGEASLAIRALSSSTSLPLPGTEGAFYPFWSPDSRYVGFFSNGKMMKILATGGPPQTICNAPNGRGGTWNSDGVIVFAPDQRQSPLHRVPAAGGESVPVTVFDSTKSDYTHRWPWFLPDGKHFLFFARTGTSEGSENDAICLGSLDGDIAKRLIRTKSDVAFANGHILYMLNGTLMAQPFDASSLEMTGDAVPIAENVSMNQRFSRAIFTVSQTGTLIFQTGTVVAGSQLTTFSRNGHVLDTVGDRSTMYVARFSPDESHIAVDITDPASDNIDIWIYNLSRGIRTRLTFDSTMSIGPMWSPDGARIAFTSSRDQKWGIYIKDASGARAAELALTIPENTYAIDWSRDGRYIAYVVPDSNGIDDIGILNIGRDTVVNRFTDTPFTEGEPRFSHDGRWLAYSSNESGDNEVYVVPFPNPTGKWQVSLAGGGFPCWSANDKELYYIDNSDRFMAVEVDGSGESFEIGAVTPLFTARAFRTGLAYEASGDGQRFVVNLLESTQNYVTLSLVLNWPEELKQR
jgi:serine/threonine protein kinase